MATVGTRENWIRLASVRPLGRRWAFLALPPGLTPCAEVREDTSRGTEGSLVRGSAGQLVGRSSLALELSPFKLVFTEHLLCARNRAHSCFVCILIPILRH